MIMDEHLIIKISENIENLTKANQDIISDEGFLLKKDFDILTSEEIKNELQRRRDTQRILRIGIIGRVKAGKSSLLNALLFEGKNILPKAATPMTAALTVLMYGEKISAEIDYFTEDDISKIAFKSEEYERKHQNCYDEECKKFFDQNQKKKKQGQTDFISENEIKSKAEKIATRRMSEYFDLEAAFDQYSRIKKSNLNTNSLEEKSINASNYEELAKMLHEFVSADGQYMPFTKSVTLNLPIKNLENIQIIDTPGLDDPVQSREERTRELLKSCEVVFVVSPSGQFINNKDLELMDRISSKQGIREIFLVASQIDHTLFSSEKTSDNISVVLNNITNKLNNQAKEALKKLKADSPEVGNTFDDLIEMDKKRVIHSSGACFSLARLFNNENEWDDNLKKVWENLLENYPSSFNKRDENTSVAHLDLIANISEIEQQIGLVRERKNEILNNDISTFIDTKKRGFQNYIKEIHKLLNDKMRKLSESQISEIVKEKENLEKILGKRDYINEQYYELVDLFKVESKNTLKSEINKCFKEGQSDVNKSQETGTKTEDYTVDKGCGFLWLRSIFGRRYETRTRTVEYTTVRSGAVRSIIENTKSEIEQSISTNMGNYIIQWKKGLFSSLVSTMREQIGDDNLDPITIKTAIRQIINSVQEPAISFSGDLPDELKKTGTLTGYSAEHYISVAQEYLNTLKKQVDNDIQLYLNNLISKLKELDLSKKLFFNIEQMINQKEEEVKNKKIYLEKYKLLIKSLEDIKCQ